MGITASSDTATKTNNSCLPGKITDDGSGVHADKTACENCPAGFQANGHGKSTCDVCGSGKISPTGAATCTPCGPGQKPNAARISCVDCPIGQFENDNECVGCPSGYSQPTGGQTSCVICGAGTKRADSDGHGTASAPCQLCNSGTYQNQQGQNSCKNCDAGYFTTTSGSKASCSDCAPGKYSASTATSCTECEAGKSSAAVRQASACGDCDSGRYQNQLAQTSCKVCGADGGNDATKKYNDQAGQTSCKTCSAPGTIANAGKNGCDNCASVINPPGTYPNAFLNSATSQCAWCNGCPKGQKKVSCSAAACDTCPVGQFKATAQDEVNTNAIKGVGWNTACAPCPVCSAGKYRSGGLCLAGGGATSNEAGLCTDCPGNQYKLQGLGETITGNYDDTCNTCEPCDAGSTRTGCGLASAGTCTGWATPTVITVTGTGQQSGGTPGNEILDIFGKFYGSAASAVDATHVVVKYGVSGTDPSTWYTALSCSVVIGDIGLAADPSLPTSITNVAQNQGQIRCLTAPGYGTGHVLTVTIGMGGSNVRTSAVFATADISYAAPIVAIYNGPGSDEASTFGGQQLVVTGANFGPIGTPVSSASYGEGPYQLPATCVVSMAHSELTCTTSAGAGKELKLVVTIGGQTSTIPAINYGVPELKETMCGTTHGELINGVPQCSCANCPHLNNNIPAITIGAVPCWHRNDIANPEGTNCPNQMPTPVAGDFNGGTRLSTKGYQLIILNGVNFGSAGTNTRDAELESVTFGPSTGTEISMPLFSPSDALTKSQAGCKIHKPTFSILCNTKPGISGPHRWIVTVKGQVSQEVVNTRYSVPQIATVVPNQVSFFCFLSHAFFFFF